MQSTLIDNSNEKLSLVYYLKQCLSLSEINELKIATGYWDLPGMVLIYDKLKAFLEREETRFYLLIGKDPRITISQQEKVKIKDPSYPKDFIKTDIEDLELKEEYQKVVNLLLKYCTSDTDAKVQVRVYRKMKVKRHSFCILNVIFLKESKRV